MNNKLEDMLPEKYRDIFLDFCSQKNRKTFLKTNCLGACFFEKFRAKLLFSDKLVPIKGFFRINPRIIHSPQFVPKKYSFGIVMVRGVVTSNTC